MTALLPIADGPELRAHARLLARRHRGALAGVVGLHGLAAAAGLVAPALLGSLVQSVGEGTTRSHIDTVVLVLAGFIALQTVLTWAARRASFVVSELMFAELREDFMRRVLALPLSTVERAGTGDLDLPHDRRRRLALADDPLRDSGDADRGADDDAHGRRRDLGQPPGRPVARRGRAGAVGRDTLVPASRAAGLPLGARRLREARRHRRGDRRRWMVVAGLAAVTGAASAQPRWDEDDLQGYDAAYDGRFVFARLRWNSGPRAGPRRKSNAWNHDFPRAEQHLARILKELTFIDAPPWQPHRLARRS